MLIVVDVNENYATVLRACLVYFYCHLCSSAALKYVPRPSYKFIEAMLRLLFRETREQSPHQPVSVASVRQFPNFIVQIRQNAP